MKIPYYIEAEISFFFFLSESKTRLTAFTFNSRKLEKSTRKKRLQNKGESSRTIIFAQLLVLLSIGQLVCNIEPHIYVLFFLSEHSLFQFDNCQDSREGPERTGRVRFVQFIFNSRIVYSHLIKSFRGKLQSLWQQVW